MPYWLSVLTIASSIASLISFIGGLLLAPPEKRRVVTALALAFGMTVIIAIGATWFVAPLGKQVPSSSETNQSAGAPVNFVTVLAELPFFAKFAGVTFAYVGILCVAFWLFTQLQVKPLSLGQAAVSVWGSHLARLRTLLLAGIICMVLSIIYPGPPLLGNFFESLHKAWYWFLYGNDASQHYSPLPVRTGTWFWGQAALLYLGCLGVYLSFAFPHEIVAAWEAARNVRQNVSGASPSDQDDRSAEALWAFVSSLVRRLSAIDRETRPKI